MEKTKLIFECENKTRNCVSFSGPSTFLLKLYEDGSMEFTEEEGFGDKNFSKKIDIKEVEEIKDKLSKVTNFKRTTVKGVSTGGIYNKLTFYSNTQKRVFEWGDDETSLKNVKILESVVWELVRLFKQKNLN